MFILCVCALLCRWRACPRLSPVELCHGKRTTSPTITHPNYSACTQEIHRGAIMSRKLNINFFKQKKNAQAILDVVFLFFYTLAVMYRRQKQEKEKYNTLGIIYDTHKKRDTTVQYTHTQSTFLLFSFLFFCFLQSDNKTLKSAWKRGKKLVTQVIILSFFFLYTNKK